MYVDVFADTYC